MILTIDIGGTNIKYGLCDESGNIQHKGEYPTLDTADKIVQSICDLPFFYDGIAISMPGILNEDHSKAFITGKLSFLSNYPLRDRLEEIKNCKVTIENDGRCATWAELGYGNLINSKNALVVVLGTYIGMGIVIDHKVYEGSHLLAGEYSDAHMDTEKTFKNTMAAYFGKDGLERATGLTGKELFNNLDDEKVYAGFDQYCQNLAWMLSNTQLLLDVDTILIGGGISAQSKLIECIKENMRGLKQWFPTLENPDIKACKFNNDANLLGALYYYKNSTENH
ncbi:ROK family protein [Holdemanella biformis]|uniref:ROK family protein n=1 Tax=Holdemanella biformis TaxID=1735 RepID=UPI002430D7F6|nr:ROK family protein [Holdemanella biformis]MBS6257769.1 ROK family protein [Holdemanella biformis]